MEFILGLPDIKVLQNGKCVRKIKSINNFHTNKERVIIRSSEVIPEFQRGFLCDMEYYFETKDFETNASSFKNIDTIKDLLLVFIEICSDEHNTTYFEYTFFK